MNIEYSVDADKWIAILPLDEIFDSKRESFRFTLSELSSGEHTIMVKVTDRAGNIGAAKVSVNVTETEQKPSNLGNETVKELKFGVSLMTDKTTYAVGEPITMALKVFNNTEEEITFHFNTSQRYDFVIADEEENKIWRWSRDRMFAMVLGEETLGPDNPEVTYTAQYKSELSPGYYKITGILVAVDRPMRGSLTILVK